MIKWIKRGEEEKSNLTVLLLEVGALFENARRSNINLVDIKKKISRIRELIVLTDKEECNDRMYRIWVTKTKECLEKLDYYLFLGDFKGIREIALNNKGTYCEMITY